MKPFDPAAHEASVQLAMQIDDERRRVSAGNRERRANSLWGEMYRAFWNLREEANNEHRTNVLKRD